MAVTRLKRKARRNRTKARVRQEDIQRLNQKPVIKSVDVEQIKEEFAKAPKTAEKKEEPKKAEAKEETKAEKKEAPKAEKKSTAKAKKEDKKEDK